MKKNLFAFSLAVLCTLTSITCFAQSEETETYPVSIPRFISKIGYWVVVSNIHTPKLYTVNFYNNDNAMVYSETIAGVVLNLDKRSTKRKLKKLVDQTVTTYALNQKAAENSMLVAKLIKK